MTRGFAGWTPGSQLESLLILEFAVSTTHTRRPHNVRMPAGTTATKAPPVRMGKLFSQMLVDCPLDVRTHVLAAVSTSPALADA